MFKEKLDLNALVSWWNELIIYIVRNGYKLSNHNLLKLRNNVGI